MSDELILTVSCNVHSVPGTVQLPPSLNKSCITSIRNLWRAGMPRCQGEPYNTQQVAKPCPENARQDRQRERPEAGLQPAAQQSHATTSSNTSSSTHRTSYQLSCRFDVGVIHPLSIIAFLLSLPPLRLGHAPTCAFKIWKIRRRTRQVPCSG